MRLTKTIEQDSAISFFVVDQAVLGDATTVGKMSGNRWFFDIEVTNNGTGEPAPEHFTNPPGGLPPQRVTQSQPSNLDNTPLTVKNEPISHSLDQMRSLVT